MRKIRAYCGTLMGEVDGCGVEETPSGIYPNCAVIENLLLARYMVKTGNARWYLRQYVLEDAPYCFNMEMGERYLQGR